MFVEVLDTLVQFSTIVWNGVGGLGFWRRLRRSWRTNVILSVDDIAGRGVWCRKNSTVLETRMDFVAGMYY